MNIFSNTNIQNDTGPISVESLNIDETETSSQILYEFNENIYKIFSATYVSDIMLESAIDCGCEDIEKLTEGIIEDRIKKAISTFADLKQKIQVWFEKITRYFGIYTKAAEKFVKDKENELKEKIKSIGTYEYTGTKFEHESEFLSSSLTYVNTAMSAIKHNKISGDAITTASLEEIDDAKADITNIVEDLADSKLKILKKFGAESYNTGSIFINSSNIDVYIKVCKSATSDIQNIKKFEKLTINEINDALRLVASSKNGSNVEKTNYLISYYNRVINGVQTLNTTIITTYKRMLTQYYNTLNRILIVKESK